MQLLIIWLIVLVGLNLTVDPMESPTLTVLFSPLNIEFILGCLSGVLVRKRILVKPILAIVIGLLWFGVGAFANASNFANFDLYLTRLIAFGCPSFLILYGCCGLEFHDNFLLPISLQKLGDASYSIYLTHLTSFAAIRRFTHGTEVIFGPEYGSFVQLGWDFLMLSTALVAGFSVYYLLEKPLLNGLRRLLIVRSATLKLAAAHQRE